MNSLRENTLRYLSYLLVSLGPVIYWAHGLYPHISSKMFFMYAIVEVMLALWLYTLIVNKDCRLSKKTLLLFIAPLAVIAWMTVVSVYAVNPKLSFWSSLGRGTGLLTFYHLFALALIIASVVRVKGMSYVVTLFKWSTVGSLILALSVWLGTDGFKIAIKVLQTDIGGGFGGNSTVSATYLLFSMAIGVFLLSRKDVSLGFKYFIGFVLTVILFSPVFINLHGLIVGNGVLGTARGTILALAAGIATSLLLYLFFSKKKIIKGLSIVGIASGVVLFVVVWMQLVTPNTYIHNKFVEQARGTRFILWDVASKAMSERPLLGYGLENYFMAFQEHFNPQILIAGNSFEGWADRAHNMYYELGTTGGYPLIIFYGIFLLSIFYAVYLLYKKELFTRFQISLFFGLFIAYIVNNLFTFDSTILLTTIFILVGIFYGLNANSQNTKSLTMIDSYYKYVVGIILLALCTTSFMFFVYRPASKSKAYAEIFVMPIDTRAKAYEKLLTGSRVGEDWDTSGLAYDIYKVYSNNPARFKNDPKLLPHVINDIAGLINYLEGISGRNSTDYRLYITKAYLYNNLLYFSSEQMEPELLKHILGVLDQAKKLSPNNPNVNWSMAQVYVWAGDFKSAENVYKEAIAIDPKLASSHRLLIQFAKIIGNQKLYTESLKQAEADIPGFSLDAK